MKNYKKIRGLVVLILVISLVACINNSNFEEKETPTQSTEQLNQNEIFENEVDEELTKINKEITEIEKNYQENMDKKVEN